MHIHLLGYSESTISRVMDILLVLGYQEEVVIIKNMEVRESIPFCPPGMNYKIKMWNDWEFDPATQVCIPAVMKPEAKRTVFDFFFKKFKIGNQNYTSAIHPAAVVSSTAETGPGNVIEPGGVIGSFARTGFGVYINRGVTIGHHVSIGDFSSINPGVHIAGHCRIGAGTQIGIGSVVFDNIKIGDNTQIGGGSVVTKDIPDNVIAWGNPCRVIRQKEEN